MPDRNRAVLLPVLCVLAVIPKLAITDDYVEKRAEDNHNGYSETKDRLAPARDTRGNCSTYKKSHCYPNGEKEECDQANHEGEIANLLMGYLCASWRLACARRSTSTRMKALLKPTWQAGVAARSAAALMCSTVMRLFAVTVVVRRSTESEK